MKLGELKAMSTAELWALREQVDAVLSRRLAAKKATVDERLRTLISTTQNAMPEREKLNYAKVVPKYRHLRDRKETWSGRGRQPRWLVAQLRSGKRLEDFLI